MSEELENKLDNTAELDEAKATGEDSMAADAVTPAGGAVKARKGDVKKKVDPNADNVEDTVKTPQGSNDTGLKESAFDKIFEGEELSEDFKTKTVAIFEAAVHDKVETVRAELEEKFNNDLEEQVAQATDELVEKVDSYLDYVVEKWMEDNEVAIESSIKVEVAESLLDSLKGLVESHKLEINQEEIDAIAEMEEKLEEQNAKYNELVDSMIAMKEEKSSLERKIAFGEVAEGLTDTQAEKLAVLAEGVTFESTEEFTAKLDAIKESYFTESVEVTTDETDLLEEEVEDEEVARTEPLDESVAAYASALGRLARK